MCPDAVWCRHKLHDQLLAAKVLAFLSEYIYNDLTVATSMYLKLPSLYITGLATNVITASQPANAVIGTCMQEVRKGAGEAGRLC